MKYLFLSLLLSIACFAQTIEVNYYENTKIPNQEQFIKMPKNLQVNYKTNVFSYKLITDGRSSLYKNEQFNIKTTEETLTTLETNEAGDTIKKIVTLDGFNLKYKEKSYYKDFTKNKSYNTKYYDEIVNIVDSIAVWKWEIINETETFLGYSCKKALTKYYGNDVIAWYTEEIPLSDGPFFYSGLPGLILKVETKHNEIIAHKITFKKELLNIEPPILAGKIFNYKTLKEYIENKNQKHE